MGLKMRKIPSKSHRFRSYETDKISLSCFDNKCSILN